MKKTAIAILFVIVIVGAITAYTYGMRYIGSGQPPVMAAPETQATRILIDKSDRNLTLLRDDQVIMSVPVSLGAVPQGHKVQEGDERTPVGTYQIDWRNQNSVAHLSLHISYPNAADTANAAKLGVSAGGNIMIHGIANGWGFLGKLHRKWDWTNGCIAVTNEEMQKIWSLVPDGTPIEIVE